MPLHKNTFFAGASLRALALSLGLGLLLSACQAPPPAVAIDPIAPRNFLGHVAAQCLDPGVANYCSRCQLPQAGASCAKEAACTTRLDLWGQTPEFFAMRDLKECGCPADFVHGLVLPKRPVTGVEDPARPDGIWAWAWQVGAQRLPPQRLALVVNPRGQRSQDQLHVHLVAIKEGLRAQVDQGSVAIARPEQAWSMAQRMADQQGLKEYGVVVTQSPQGGWQVLISAQSPERLYTQYRCE